MYTPQEIRSIEFTKTLGGYKTTEVDDFIDGCADTVEALLKEKNELAKKLDPDAMTGKIYAPTPDRITYMGIRTALLSAQRLGDTVVREANHKAGLILDDANIKAKKIEETAKRNIVDEEKELERVKKEVSLFKNRMMSIYREHLSLIGLLPEEENTDETAKAEPAPTPSEPVPVPTEENPAPVSEKESVPGQAEEPIPVPTGRSETAAYEETVAAFRMNVPILDEDPPVSVEANTAASSGQSTNRFADLKFGDDYDISQDTDEEPRFFRKKRSDR